MKKQIKDKIMDIIDDARREGYRYASEEGAMYMMDHLDKIADIIEENPEPKIEQIDLNDAFNAIGTKLLKMYNNGELPDKKYNQACNYVDWLSYLINEGVDLDNESAR